MPHPDELQSYRQSNMAIEAEKILEEIMEKKTVCSIVYSIKYNCCFGGMIGPPKTKGQGSWYTTGSDLQRGHRGDVYLSSSILFKYEGSMGHLFVLSWARVRMVVRE